jgi:hypothetical protein
MIYKVSSGSWSRKVVASSFEDAALKGVETQLRIYGKNHTDISLLVVVERVLDSTLELFKTDGLMQDLGFFKEAKALYEISSNIFLD